VKRREITGIVAVTDDGGIPDGYGARWGFAASDIRNCRPLSPRIGRHLELLQQQFTGDNDLANLQ
jgi:hypothetical protein